jgi:hypothetical protein
MIGYKQEDWHFILHCFREFFLHYHVCAGSYSCPSFYSMGIGGSSFPRGIGPTHPSVLWAVEAYFPELKEPQHAADHTTLTSG